MCREQSKHTNYWKKKNISKQKLNVNSFPAKFIKFYDHDVKFM